MSKNNPFDVKYLLDSTFAATLKGDFIQSRFFRESCFLSDEIIYEQKDNNLLNLADLQNNILKTDGNILQKLQIVMEKAEIVKLYQNEGNGDVLTLATALAKSSEDTKTLFSTEWKIVTSDNGLKKLAQKFGIECLDNNEFRSIIEHNI